MRKLFILIKNNVMNNRELIDKISMDLLKETGKQESLKSWLTIRNYLKQLSTDQLKAMLKKK